MKALILIAHGSKRDSSNNEFKQMVENIKERSNDFDFIEASFLELCSPDIKTTTIELIKKGVKNISFYPFFLNSGKHVLVDIPSIVEELKKEYSDINFTLMKHFGKSETIETIILNDIS